MARLYGQAFLACLLMLQVSIFYKTDAQVNGQNSWPWSYRPNGGGGVQPVAANPYQAGQNPGVGGQPSYYNYPNGQLKLLNNGQTVCGQCPAGTQREAVSGPYCGRCLAPTQTCASGNYLVNGQCQPCPCPGTTSDRRFGTSCKVDVDGQVTCDCPSEYTGRDCSQCAPGAVQSNQPPYNCVRPNSTNSFSITCGAGNTCTQPQIPQIVQPRPTCPYTSQPIATGCPYTNQTTGLCPGNTPCPQQQTPCQTGGCPVTCPGNGNGGTPQCPCPSPCGCPTNGCPGSCPGTQPPCVIPTQPPTTRPPWTPAPPPPCPGPVQCPVIQPPSPCPINPTNPAPCPVIQPPSPCPVNPTNPTPCPVIQPPAPCPVNPTNPSPCPVIQPPSPCPVNPTNPTPCPINPVNPCSPCNIPTPQPCVTIPEVNCPNPCPQIPSCPPCQLTCPECPTCQQCGGDNCQICPNPCQPCPSYDCPPCNLKCPDCNCQGTNVTIPPLDPIIELCICDPRGTAAQVGNECICKVNVQGARCDQCKAGYFGLTSTRPEGCLACFCSGLSTSCSLTPYYRTSIRTDSSANCTIELTDENHSVVYSKGSSGFSWDGTQASMTKGVNNRLFWSLPSCLKGDRVTSYGGLLSFTRMCSGSGNPLGADHEVILVAGSGATVFWTTFEAQRCDGKWTHVDVLLAEVAYWSSWKGEQYRRATRADIMEVLADLQLILIRATFTSNTMSTSIRNVSLSTVSHSSTTEGIALQVESCRCPVGYRGLSCENCEPGYYRDTTDMSRSVFGACKPCPCGKTSSGCHLSAGQVVCTCKPGFSGPLCQDKEVITVSCDPFRIREMEGSMVDFTCSFTTNSKRRLLLRLGREGHSEKGEETTSLTKSIKLDKDLRRVVCDVVDTSGVTWAVIYCAIEVLPVTGVIRPPPPRLIAMIPTETFICVDEGATVTMSCEMHNFGQRKITIEWRKEGNPVVMSSGKEVTIRNVVPGSAGTYICSASDGEVTGAGQIALMVRRNYLSMRLHYPVNATGQLELGIHARHGGDYPNHPYQSDADTQADAPAQAGNNTQQQQPSPKIDPVSPGHPKAMVDPAEVTAKPGDTVILRCNATGQEPLKFYWKSGSNDYIPSHVRMSHGALIFRSLRSQDAGVYYCVAWNHLGQSTARATISLDNSAVATATPVPNNDVVETGKPIVEVLHPEITARPGENVNFQCRSNQTSVKYVWSRVGDLMPNSSEVRSDGLLTLYRVSDKDKGTYVCTVTNTVSGEKTTSEAVLKLKPVDNLMVPPRVTIKPKSPLRVRTGEKVRLECESIGSPVPNVTWVRSIDGTEKKLVSTPSNKVIYEIKQMAVTDVGKYTCNAVNSAGRKSESLSLVIDDGKRCKENEFRCKSGDQCIPRDDRCDNEKDCRDGSDEDNCKGSRRVRRHAKV